MCRYPDVRAHSSLQFTQLYPHNSHGGVDLAAIAKEAGACKHFCASKWAKVGGMLQVTHYHARADTLPRFVLSLRLFSLWRCAVRQMDGTTKFAGAGGVDTSKYSF